MEREIFEYDSKDKNIDNDKKSRELRLHTLLFKIKSQTKDLGVLLKFEHITISFFLKNSFKTLHH